MSGVRVMMMIIHLILVIRMLYVLVCVIAALDVFHGTGQSTADIVFLFVRHATPTGRICVASCRMMGRWIWLTTPAPHRTDAHRLIVSGIHTEHVRRGVCAVSTYGEHTLQLRVMVVMVVMMLVGGNGGALLPLPLALSVLGILLRLSPLLPELFELCTAGKKKCS